MKPKQYNHQYYKKNKDMILLHRRQKYSIDEEYRQRAMEKRRKWYEANRDKNVRHVQIPSRLRVVDTWGQKIPCMNKADFARFIGVSRTTVDKWHKADVLPYPCIVDGIVWYPLNWARKVLDKLGYEKRAFKMETLKVLFQNL